MLNCWRAITDRINQAFSLLQSCFGSLRGCQGIVVTAHYTHMCRYWVLWADDTPQFLGAVEH